MITKRCQGLGENMRLRAIETAKTEKRKYLFFMITALIKKHTDNSEKNMIGTVQMLAPGIFMARSTDHHARYAVRTVTAEIVQNNILFFIFSYYSTFLANKNRGGGNEVLYKGFIKFITFS